MKLEKSELAIRGDYIELWEKPRSEKVWFDAKVKEDEIVPIKFVELEFVSRNGRTFTCSETHYSNELKVSSWESIAQSVIFCIQMSLNYIEIFNLFLITLCTQCRLELKLFFIVLCKHFSKYRHSPWTESRLGIWIFDWCLHFVTLLCSTRRDILANTAKTRTQKHQDAGREN